MAHLSARGTRTSATWLARRWLDLGCTLPLFAYVLLLTGVPILDTVRLSLTGSGDAAFPSLASYRAIFASEVFRTAVGNTVVVALLSMTLQLLVGLAVALALHRRFPLRGVVRTIVLLPLGVPTVVAGAVMLLVFARSGYANALLFALADLVNLVPGVQWQFTPLAWVVAGGWRSLLTLAIADMWKVLPLVVLIFLAGLEAIAPELYEAAGLDGASRWQRFRHVTLPLLAPYVTMAVILRAIDAFRIFELALVLTGRVEPVLGTYIWSRYGPPTHDPFTAAAAAVVLAGLIAAFVALYLALVARRAEATA